MQQAPTFLNAINDTAYKCILVWLMGVIGVWPLGISQFDGHSSLQTLCEALAGYHDREQSFCYSHIL